MCIVPFLFSSFILLVSKGFNLKSVFFYLMMNDKNFINIIEELLKKIKNRY